MSDRKRIGLSLCLAMLLAGCGQTGRLYLPQPAGEVVTRPAQTPDSAPATAPEDADKDKKADKKN